MKILTIIILSISFLVSSFGIGYLKGRHSMELKLAKKELKTNKEIKKYVTKVNASSSSELDNELRKLGYVQRQ